jgi:hypothetical protein
MNSILQALAATPLLLAVLTYTPVTSALGSLYETFHQLILDLHDPNIRYIDAHPFVINFYEKVSSGVDSERNPIWSQFQPSYQQDASEFLTKLMHLLSHIPDINIIFTSSLESKLTCSANSCIGYSVRNDPTTVLL